MSVSRRWGTAAVAAAWVIAGAIAAAAEGGRTETPAAAPTAAGVPAADAAAPVARVNGTVISRGDYERHLAFVLRRAGGPDGREGGASGERPEFAADGTAATTDVRVQVLDRLIDEELLYLESRKRGLLAAGDAVDAEIAQARAQFPAPEAFAAALAENGFSEATLRAVIGRNLSIQSLVEKGVAAGVTVTDAEVREFYSANAESFAIPEQVRARHILVQFGEADDEAAKRAKRSKAEDLLGQLKAGADFAELARANSDCSSAAEGGDLGLFERGQMVPEFDAAAFALKSGETSGVVETEYGYHIIRLEERQAAGAIPEKDAAPQITEYLRTRKTVAAVEALVRELRGAATIEKLL